MSVEHYNNIVSYVRAFYDAELLRRRLSDMDEDEGSFRDALKSSARTCDSEGLSMPPEAWAVDVHRSVEALLHALPRESAQRIYSAIAELTEDPYLDSRQPVPGIRNTFEIQVDAFRIIYQIEEEEKRVKVAAVTLNF